VINAIAHKDDGSGIPIQISVYHDKVKGNCWPRASLATRRT
jgi:hypothetical protein